MAPNAMKSDGKSENGLQMDCSCGHASKVDDSPNSLLGSKSSDSKDRTADQTGVNLDGQ